MKHLVTFLSLFLTVAVLFTGCKKEEEPEETGTCTDGILNQDEVEIDCGGSCSPCVDDCGTVTDVDGNTYNTVVIGNQCWMKENLKVTKFNDNTPISYEASQSFWANLTGTQPAYTYYDNDLSNEAKYGKLYNWYVVNNGNVCPDGYHIPTQAEWNELINHLGGVDAASDKLRAIDPDSWGQWDEATNTSGFSALPGGQITNQGEFRSSEEAATPTASFLSATEVDTYWCQSGPWISSIGDVIFGETRKNSGHACRCVKD